MSFQQHEEDVELSQFLSSSPRGSFYSLRTVDDDRDEQEPLISATSSSVNSPRSRSPRPQHQYLSVDAASNEQNSSSSNHLRQDVYRKRDASLMDTIVGKANNTRLSRLIDNFAVEAEPGLTNTQLMLTNHDLKPVEPELRQWGTWNFVGFWVGRAVPLKYEKCLKLIKVIADSFNINTWMISSSAIVGSGLSWWQAWICVWIGYSIAACFVCATARIGAMYHISFPVVARSSFGIWGSLWPVFNRAAMACIWYGVQAWIGGTCVKIMICSIWKSYETLPNTMPATSGTNTRDFVAFFIFWLCSLPAIWFPVHKIRHLFTVKAYFVPTAGLAFFIWAIVKAHGLGPIVHQPSEARGSKLVWGIVTAIMSSIANFATLIVNIPDFSRFARRPRDALLPQLVTIPIGFAVTSFIGIIVSSSSIIIYNEAIWNPLDLLTLFLKDASPGERLGVFIIASAFTLAQLGTNIAANSVSAGTDLTALLPRYLDIRRGGYICAAVGLAMCPWNLLSSSNKFITYLSAYSVFLSSIAGVIVCDYFWVRKGYLEIKHLYSGRHTDPYFYTAGFNWRGYAAYIFGILVNIVGFVGAIGIEVPVSAMYIYNLNFFCGFFVASGVYWILCYYFPVPALSPTGRWMEVGDEITRVSVAYEDVERSGDVEQDSAYVKAAEAQRRPGLYHRI